MKIVKRNTSNGLTPYVPFRSMLDDFISSNSWMDEVFDKTFPSKNLYADVWEEDDNFFIKMALPGVNKDNIEITTTPEAITIKGCAKKEEEKVNDKKNYYFKSIDNSFEQTFNLPARFDSDKAVAKYENGILTLTLPKSDEVKSKKIEIQ